ncbi:MAG: serine/threonine protein kinase [Candidatus Schekmanbacteria bacterium]|nr:serine/threonine protein kinase [Candidatus Schekmanbacteria bacterium]
MSDEKPAGPQSRPILADRYVLEAEIGRGGSGRVFRAFDTELQVSIALKLLKADIAATKAGLTRFRREIVTARSLAHPNICRIYELGQDRGRRFVTMELVDGDSLASLLLREAPLPVWRIADILAPVTSALALAHEQGIVHRDLKPQNIMVGRDGTVKVMDFGLAYRAEASQITSQDQVVGTPSYMAPEQIYRNAVTLRTDIYSLGIMFYQMLTGLLPFEADTPVALMFHHVNTAPPYPGMRVPPVIPEAGNLAVDAMAKNPDDRPQTAEAFMARLREAVAMAQSRAKEQIVNQLAAEARAGELSVCLGCEVSADLDPALGPFLVSDARLAARLSERAGARGVVWDLAEGPPPEAMTAPVFVPLLPGLVAMRADAAQSEITFPRWLRDRFRRGRVLFVGPDMARPTLRSVINAAASDTAAGSRPQVCAPWSMGGWTPPPDVVVLETRPDWLLNEVLKCSPTDVRAAPESESWQPTATAGHLDTVVADTGGLAGASSEVVSRPTARFATNVRWMGLILAFSAVAALGVASGLILARLPPAEQNGEATAPRVVSPAASATAIRGIITAVAATGTGSALTGAAGGDRLVASQTAEPAVILDTPTRAATAAPAIALSPSPSSTPKPPPVPTATTRRPADVPSASPGLLKVLVGAGWAKVFVDGIYIDSTPCNAISLAPGPHRLVLAEGLGPGRFETQVQIESDKTVEIRHQFN